MKKLITIIIIGLSFYSCAKDGFVTETVNVSFDMQDNSMKYGSEIWKVNLDPETKEPINKVGLERTEYGFVIKSKERIVELTLLNDFTDYEVNYIDPFNIEVFNDSELDALFYWFEVIELELTFLK